MCGGRSEGQINGGNKSMRKTRIMIATIVVGMLCVAGAQAQDTNAPLTHLEIFEYQTGTVIVRGSVLVGTVLTQIGTVSVRARNPPSRDLGRRNMGLPLC